MSSILGDLGALFGGIAGLAPVFGGGSSGDGRGAAKRALKQQTYLQERAYFRGIQDKVADAKAAGLHPLFALGASANFSPVPIAFPYDDSTEQFRLAAHGAEAIGRGLEGLSRRAVEAQISKDEALAMEADAKAAKAAQEALAINKSYVTPSGDVWRVGKGTPAEIWEEQYADWANIPAAQMFFRDWLQHRANLSYRRQRERFGEDSLGGRKSGKVPKGDYYRDADGVLHIRIK